MLYLHLFHGRNSADEDMDDWGFDGPCLGPFRYVHVTYMGEVKFAMEVEAYKAAFPDDPEPHVDWEERTGTGWVESRLSVVDDCIEFDGKFYGDWSVAAADIMRRDGLI